MNTAWKFALLFLVTALSTQAQSSTVLEVQKNLMDFIWDLTMYNETGLVDKGTGLCDFNRSDITSGKNTKHILWFEITSSRKTIGGWDIVEISPGAFHLIISFDNSSESPFRPNVPVTFQVIDPFTPESMSLELIPPPETYNSMELTKHL
jgi:hypothetical protein